MIIRILTGTYHECAAHLPMKTPPRPPKLVNGQSATRGSHRSGGASLIVGEVSLANNPKLDA
eukprot:7346844-Prymnesium_polylepis.1